MSSPIPQAAIDAALKRYDYPSGRAEPSDAAHEERLTAALEAAMPHIWAQIDVDELAEVIADHDSLGYVANTGVECECGELVAGPDDDRPYRSWRLHTARVVIAHLAGKDAK